MSAALLLPPKASGSRPHYFVQVEPGDVGRCLHCDARPSSKAPCIPVPVETKPADWPDRYLGHSNPWRRS